MATTLVSTGVTFPDGTTQTSAAALVVITSVSPSSFNGTAGTVFTINGSNFSTGATVTFVGNDGTLYPANTTTFVNAFQLTAPTPQVLLVANEPYGVKVTLASGSSTTITGLIDAGSGPNWVTASGSLGSVFEGTSASFTVSATDPDTGAITYSVVSGSLPTGLSLNSSTGAITGTAPSVASDTAYSFTIRATDAATNYADRAFSITVLNNVAPSWVTPAGNLGTIYDRSRTGVTYTLQATDVQTVTYSIVSGSLPTGMSLNSSTGVISGTPNAVATDTTSTFTARASDGVLSSDRSFNIIVKAPVSLLYTAGQSGTFTVPTGVTSLLVTVAGGGGGGSTTSCGGQRYAAGGGGGAAQKTYTVSGGQNYSYAAGSGGTGYNYGGTCEPPGGGAGGTSTFSAMSATGGGGGKSGVPGNGYTEVGGAGGSGSGGDTNQTGGTGGIGSGGAAGTAPALASAVGSYSTGGTANGGTGQSGFVRIQYQGAK